MIVEYKPEHLKDLLLQPAQAYMRAYMNDEYAEFLNIPGMTYTAMHAGQVVGCGGLVPQWEGRAQAWTLISGEVPNFLEIHRYVAKVLKECKFRRIEATVDCDFVNGHEWMRILGFQWEGTMKCFSPEGRDADLYALVK